MVLRMPRWRWTALATIGRSALALALALIAAANLAVVLLARPQAQAVFLSSVVNLEALGWGRDGAIVAGTLLLVVSRSLARGKRHAWLLAIGLLTLQFITSRLTHHSMRYLLIDFVALVGLVALAPLFPTRSDPRATRRGYAAIALSLAGFVALQVILRVWDPEFTPLTDTLRPLALLLVQASLFITLTYGLVEVLRPVIGVRRQHGERDQALKLIHSYATHATAHFIAAPEMSYFWSTSGQSFIAYRLMRGVALALGDPVGPADEHAKLLADFVDYCRRQDWVCATYLASPALRQIGQRAGLRAYKIGEEAIIEIGRFSTAGKSGAPVRHSMTRARRDGVSVRIWQGEALPADIFAGMKAVSHAWLTERGNTMQMGFSMGRFPADWSPDLLSVVALDASGQVCAFQTWTPLYAGHGWSLDAMRRTATTPPGVMELLTAEAVEWARPRGYERMSLGLAPLAGLQRDEAACENGAELAALTRLERGVGYLHQRRLLLGAYASLYHFKAKFQPTWEARYLIVNDRVALPQTLSALMHAQGYRWWRAVLDTIEALRGQLSRPSRAAN
jgi:phosphatidylglycerol lysyltransferase